jgi:SSS family solute:Na+ symporter
MLTAIVCIYLITMISVGVFLRKRVKSTTDFLIAGRRLGILLISATLAAVQIGAGVILGGSELGAEMGVWPGMWYGIGCGGGLILAGLLVASKLRKRGGFVPLDFFGSRYGERRWVRLLSWIFNIPSILGIFIAQLMAAGSICSIFGFSYAQGVIVIGVVIVIYSTLAGMWGVVVNDFIQLGIILTGIPLVALTAATKLGHLNGMTIGNILSVPFIPAHMLSRAVFIIIPFFMSISVSYDAFMRYQAAKSDRVAKWGCIFGGIIVIIVSFCVGLIGSIGKILFPSLQNKDVLPNVVQSLFHPALAGLVLSALLAAVMSSSNCLLISFAGCFTRDFYNKVLHPSSQLDELKYSGVISRGAVLAALIAGIIIALKAQGILYTMIIFNYPYMGSLLVPLLGGVLWKRATAKGAIAAIITGGTIGVVSFLAGVPGRLHGLFNVDLGLFFAYALSTVVFILVSLKTDGIEQKFN